MSDTATGSPESGTKRDDIVRTAATLFFRDGYHATGIDRIIENAAVAKATMYRHFASKEELILDVLSSHAARFAREVDALVDAASTVEAKVDAVFGWYEEWFGRTNFNGCMFAHAMAEHNAPTSRIFQAVVEQKEGVRSRLKAIVEERVPAARAEELAWQLLMLLEGATLTAQMGASAIAIGIARDAALHLLATNLSPQAQ